jgi:hypothetical protein
MIVRVMGEGRWRVDDELARRLNELDDEAGRAVEADDQDALSAALKALADLVRGEGTRVEDSDLTPSDAIVPPEDLTIAEAHELLEGEGLIPDLPE